jgi:CubicO group peptidase (beta-lactamase class C family)
LILLGATGTSLPAGEEFNWQTWIEEQSAPVLKDGRSVGLVVGISDAQGQRFCHGVGTCRPDGSRPTPTTIFAIGSITKTFTTLLLAESVRRGEVRLDDPVECYLPADWVVPRNGDKKVTLLDLATHTSGLPRDAKVILRRVLWDRAWANNPFGQLDEALIAQTLQETKIDSKTVGTVSYSNLGMGLLGEALAHRSGKSFAELTAETLTEPLKMASTFEIVPESDRPRQARGHGPKGVEVPDWTFGRLAGCGALQSIAEDLLTYLEAQSGRRPTALSDAMVLTQEKRADAGNGQSVCLGWFRQTTVQGLELWWHDGGTDGFTSCAIFCRSPATAVVVLSCSGAAVDAGSVDALATLTMKKLLEGSLDQSDTLEGNRP